MSKETKPPVPKKEPEEQIRERAYYLWEKEGRPEGRDLDHWLVAQTGEFPTSGQKASKSTTKKSTRQKATDAKAAGKKPAARKKAVTKSKKKAPKQDSD